MKRIQIQKRLEHLSEQSYPLSDTYEKEEDIVESILENTNKANILDDVLVSALTPKAAVSYLRVSTHDQAERGGGADEGFSIPAQREANKKKASSIGAIIIKEFVDRGASARSADRPELQKLLDYVNDNKNQVDYVIVHKVDRLARNRGDDVDITRAFQKAGVKLVSTTESIDDTPSGMLLHGIMSSIAEFYSRNLSNEVSKGMTQKVKNGGTIHRAPLGYKNLRTVDNKGRENRTVVIDEERAPMIQAAFDYYATGEWSVKELADYMARRGLTTLSTPKIASKPIDRSLLNKILINPYYKGVVTFKGVQYDGNHDALVDDKTWQKVQDVLASHVNGERKREHPHFLKSTIYCKKRGARMLIHNAKSRSGMIYPYFVCAAKNGRRHQCNLRAVLINEVERQIELLYERISITQELRLMLEEFLGKQIKDSAKEFETERRQLEREKDKLERKSAKLLEAHYADAISLEMFKSEQDSIRKALLDIDDRISTEGMEYEIMSDILKQALDLIEDCGRAYKNASDKVKRAFNQAIFEKILVDNDAELTPVFNAPFNILLGLNNSKIILELSNIDACENLKNNDPENESNPVQSNFFEQGSIMGLLVELGGVEPPSESI